MNIKSRKMAVYFGVAVGLMVANVTQAQNSLPFVQVKAYMQCYGGNFVYHYKVINNQAKASIGSFAVGRTNDRWDERPELIVEPVVVNENYKITAPPGWQGGGGPWEEFPDYSSIEWRIEDMVDFNTADARRFIGPRQTLAGFSVTLDRKV